MSTEDSMRKSTENLDHEAGAAPSSEYLDKVDPDEFGRQDETDEDENDESGDDEAADGGGTANRETAAASGEDESRDSRDDS